MGGGGGSSLYNKAVGVAGVVNPINWVAAIPPAIKRAQAGMATPGKDLAAAQKVQSEQAAQMQADLLRQPKAISPDNFLAMKNKALTNLRLGLASTITGAGSAPSAVLSSPSLSASGSGKTKLGS